MESLRTLAAVLEHLGFLLYAGPMVAFTVLVVLAERIPDTRPWELVRAYRAWGGGFGLALGACILGMLSGRWLDRGAFTWAWGTSAEQLDLAYSLLFLLMWASNLFLEIWTLDPLRKLDPKGVVSDPAAYSAARARQARPMMAQSAMLLVLAILQVVAR